VAPDLSAPLAQIGGTGMSRSHRSRQAPLDHDQPPRLLDVNGAAVYLGTSARHVRRMVGEKRIPYTKLGKGRSARLRFRVDRLAQWVEEHSFEPENQA
jgi:excisionase family DNA binding protein